MVVRFVTTSTHGIVIMVAAARSRDVAVKGENEAMEIDPMQGHS